MLLNALRAITNNELPRVSKCERDILYVTHVIKAAVRAWKKKASPVNKPLKYAPILVHNARTPVSSAKEAKKFDTSENAKNVFER